MKNHSRREFIGDVGRGMLIAGLGPALAGELGVTSSWAGEELGLLDFGELRPLVTVMQETPLEKLQPVLVQRYKDGGANLRQMVAAASLANAETFGGDDYVGFHTEMALLPAFNMSRLLPAREQPLPVLKVLYRNAERIRSFGREKKTLRPIKAAGAGDSAGAGRCETLLKATREGDMKRAEGLFSEMTSGPVDAAFDELQCILQDDMNVHRFVLAHRALGLTRFVGLQHAHTLLRQSVRFCVNASTYATHRMRDYLLTALDRHRLVGRKPGTRRPDDGWVEELNRVIYQQGKEKAVDAVAAALAEGVSLEAIGESVSLAANQLVLRQGEGRTHGDSRGVHGSDAVNAWRNMVREVSPDNAMLGMLVAAYHTADYSTAASFKGEPLPHEKHRESVAGKDAGQLLREADGAIRENDQARAAAAIDLYGEKGFPAKPVFDLMLKYAVTEDGRLHGEKYYQTVTEEYATTREAFRWRQLVALARVTASSYGYNREDKAGYRAPGYEEAKRLLGV